MRILKTLFSATIGLFIFTLFCSPAYAHPHHGPSTSPSTIRIGTSSCNRIPASVNWNTIGENNFDVFLFLGDNIYLPSQSSIPESIYTSYYDDFFRSPSLTQFLRATREIPIWDDHDFGPNNSDSLFQDRTLAEEYFRKYWKIEARPNGFDRGIHRRIDFQFITFLLVDNRSFRINEGADAERKHFGAKQLEWITNELRSAKDTLVIIASGGQLLTSGPYHEHLKSFPDEYQALINAITESSVPVVILSGDRHFGDIIQRSFSGKEVLEMTASPLSGRTAKSRIPYPQIGRRRIVIGTPNFGQLTVTKGETGYEITSELKATETGETLRRYQTTLPQDT